MREISFTYITDGRLLNNNECLTFNTLFNMKALAINTKNIIENSARVMALKNTDAVSALSKGMGLEALKKRMMRGEVVRFAYQKLDKSIRIAVGTLQAQAVKANVVGTGLPKHLYGMFAYLDMEKMAWRGFKEELFIGIID